MIVRLVAERSRGHVQEIERHARVAVRVADDRGQRVRLHADAVCAKPALDILHRSLHDRPHRLVCQRLQHVHLGARQERGVHLERRVLGGRADEDDVARLDARQEGVLLSFVEPVDLVDEENRAASDPAPGLLGLGHDRADFLDAREDRAERNEPRPRDLCDEARERGLAGSGRAPENDRLQAVVIDGLAQGTTGAEQHLLADELVERPRAHPLGERRGRAGGGLRFGLGLVKQ